MGRAFAGGSIPLLALAAAAAGCAAPAQGRQESGGKPVVHGGAGLTVFAHNVNGRVAFEGDERSTGGSPRSGGAGLFVDLVGDPASLYFDVAGHGLPGDLKVLDSGFPYGRDDTEYHRLDLALGVRVLEIPSGDEDAPGRGEDAPARRALLRVDPYIGLRRHTFVQRDLYLGLFPGSGGSERWTDGIAGLRIEAQLAESFGLRLRADSLVGGRSEDAWRATAALNVGWGAAWFALGWEASSVEFEKGSGIGLVRYDVLLSGPFVSFEVRF